MAYITLDQYTALYPGDDISDTFSRLAWDASRLMDRMTTGIDGVKKLSVYPPEGDDAESVTMCAAKLVHLMYQIETLEAEQIEAAKITKQADGTYQSAMVSSRSAGNESISYANGSELKTSSIIGAAVSDLMTRDKLYRDTADDCLRGVRDANRVNLLYMGRYPRV